MREYIGARYVPKLANPFAWDDSTVYEPLTIVGYNGASYTSRTTVPAGTLPTNESYWALTGNYNGQVESLREEVSALSDEVQATPIASFDEETEILNLGYPSTEPEDSDYDVEAIQLGDEIYHIRQTKHYFSDARGYIVVSTQEEFEAALSKLNDGENSLYVKLTEGSYSVRINNITPVFANCSLHIISETESCTLNLAGAVFYNCHLNISGTNMVITNTTSSAGRIENGSTVISGATIECNLRFRGGSAQITSCVFIYTDLLTAGSFIDSLGANITCRTCSFTGLFPESFAIFGIGDGGLFTITGSTNFDPASSDGVRIFIQRDGITINTVNWHGSCYNTSTSAKFTAANPGGFKFVSSLSGLFLNVTLNTSTAIEYMCDVSTQFKGTLQYLETCDLASA